MPKLPLKDAKNHSLAPVEGSEHVFAEIKREHIVSEVVRYQMARRHLGTHRAKTRSYISLSSAKPFAQKGTGRARRGDFRSPLLRGGGVIHPPEPRDYDFDLPKKARKTALRSVLTNKLVHEKLMILTDHGLTAIKTKAAIEFLKKLGLTDALLVTSKRDKVLEQSVRNLPNFKVLRVDGLNVYDVLNYDQLVIFQEALPILEKRLQ